MVHLGHPGSVKKAREGAKMHNIDGDNPDRVPSELFIRGGFGGDGFSGCTDRVGLDIDKNTSSRYVLGMKIARILGKRNFNDSFPRATEYFVETSQSFVTVKPILIGQFKETTENLHEIWKFCGPNAFI